MKRKQIFLIVLVLLFPFSVFSETSYGEVIDITQDGNLGSISVSLPLSFTLKDSERYEFGFTQDSNVTLRTNTNPCSEIPLAQNEASSDLTSDNPYLAASASFKVYWKIVSGLNLSFFLKASGPLEADGSSQNTIHYSIMQYESGSNYLAILGARKGDTISSASGPLEGLGDVDSRDYTDSVLIGSYAPDYDSQTFSTAAYSDLSIISNENILDKPFVINGETVSYVTTLTLEVAVK